MKELKLYPHLFSRLGSLFLVIFISFLSVLAGCQLLPGKSNESSVDAQLSKTEPPAAQIPMANNEPQKGFEQEPSGTNS